MTTFKIGDRVRINYSRLQEACPNLFRELHGKVGRIVSYTFPLSKAVTLEFDDGKNKNVSTMYLEKIASVKVGDRVRCTKFIMFMDGVEHKVGDVFTVTRYDSAYFNWAINNGDYELLPPEPVYSVLYAKRIIGGDRMSYKRTFEKLAAAIVSAYTAVDEYQYDSASVYVGDSINTIFTCFKMDDAIHCIKSPACKIDKQDIVTALQTED